MFSISDECVHIANKQIHVWALTICYVKVKLSAHDASIIVVPSIVTDSAPATIETNFHSSLKALIDTSQTNITIVTFSIVSCKVKHPPFYIKSTCILYLFVRICLEFAFSFMLPALLSFYCIERDQCNSCLLLKKYSQIHVCFSLEKVCMCVCLSVCLSV